MLGRGSFGTVYSKDMFAVKRSVGDSFENLQAIVRELFVLRLKLKGCIKYHNVKTIQKIFYIYMDVAEGDLRKMNAPPNYEVQLISAVHELHRHNIVHRDLKPENILVKKDQIFLCDFGLSRTLHCDVEDGTGYMVSRWYRAPEIYFNLTEKLAYTKKMDCWSVGCILYEVENKKPLNSDMSFLIQKKLKKKMHKKLCAARPVNRWSMEDCLQYLNVGFEKSKLPDAIDFKFNEESKKWLKAFPHKKKVFKLAQKMSDKYGYYKEFLFLSILLLDSSGMFYTMKDDLRDIDILQVYYFIKNEIIFQHISSEVRK